jgi:hypothetical protein
MREGETSIWFFIGISLLVNGLLIFAAGAYEWFNPPAVRVVLFHLHANLWWGVLLLLIGAVYVWKFRPRSAKTARSMAAKQGRV